MEQDGTGTDRRSILKKVGLGGAAGLLAVGSYSVVRERPPEEPEPEPDPEPKPEPEPEPDPSDELTYLEEYDIVLDAVEEGADPEGEESINFLFDEQLTDDTLVTFPAGTYSLDPLEVIGMEHVGIAAQAGEDVSFTTRGGDCLGGHPFFLANELDSLRLDGITFDFRGVDAGGPIHLFLGGESHVTDVEYVGTCHNQLAICRIEVRDETGTAEFERFEATNVKGNHTLTGVYVGGDHSGDLTFRDCHLEGFSDNGLYASAPGHPGRGNGGVHVEGGYYSNNNIASVRLGSTGSTARDVTVVVDDETPGWGDLNARGFRFRERNAQVVEHCDVTFGENAANSFGVFVFHHANDGATVRNTTVTHDRDDVPVIRAFYPEREPDTAPVFENLTVTGTAGEGSVADIEARDGTEFSDCTIEQTGANRDGLVFRNSDDCLIESSRIDVTARPLVLDNATVRVRDTTIRGDGIERTFDDEILRDGDLAT